MFLPTGVSECHDRRYASALVRLQDACEAAGIVHLFAIVGRKHCSSRYRNTVRSVLLGNFNLSRKNPIQYPVDSFHLSSMHSIGSAHADFISAREDLFARTLPIECFSLTAAIWTLPRCGRRHQATLKRATEVFDQVMDGYFRFYRLGDCAPRGISQSRSPALIISLIPQ